MLQQIAGARSAQPGTNRISSGMETQWQQAKAIRRNLIALLKEECGIDNHLILHN